MPDLALYKSGIVSKAVSAALVSILNTNSPSEPDVAPFEFRFCFTCSRLFLLVRCEEAFKVCKFG